jgi:hypothetical protein
MRIQISKPTSMPGEFTTIIAHNVGNDVGELRLAIGRAGKAIDWRIRQENNKKLEFTRRRLEKLNIKIPGFARTQ